jgi:chromatin-remodeling ATPase INO80
MAKPLHVQRLEKALELGPFMAEAESILSKNDEIENSSDDESVRRHTYQDKELMFNSENIGEDRKWLFDLLLSETESESEISDTDKYIGEMLRDHVREKRYRQKYHQNPNVSISYVITVEVSQPNSALERSIWILQRGALVQS